MAAPRFWFASSSNRPRCKAVVTSFVAARAGDARMQRAAQRRMAKLKLPPFDGEIVAFITVCFIIFVSSLRELRRVSCHPFVKSCLPHYARCLRLPLLSAGQFELIAHAVDGLDPLRRIGVALDLAAQAGDVVIHSARGRECGIAPDDSEEPFAGDGFAGDLSH